MFTKHAQWSKLIKKAYSCYLTFAKKKNTTFTAIDYCKFDCPGRSRCVNATLLYGDTKINKFYSCTEKLTTTVKPTTIQTTTSGGQSRKFIPTCKLNLKTKCMFVCFKLFFSFK